MQGVRWKIRQKAKTVTLKRNLNEAFRNEDGAIDLASIMVGIIVIGLIGGVIAATVFAVIPWTQDNAAKHQLDSIAAAQSAYMGLSSDSPPALPAGHKANSFGDSAALAAANLLSTGATYCAVTAGSGKGYQGYSQSSSGKIWTMKDSNTKPWIFDEVIDGQLPTDCNFITEGFESGNGSGDGDGNEEAAYVDPSPTTTALTYKCNTRNATTDIPISGSVTGKLTVNGVQVGPSYMNAASISSVGIFEAGVEYKVVFEGTYDKFSALETGEQILSPCLRSVDHWGVNTGVSSASNAFKGSVNLTNVPEHIPASITAMDSMFLNAHAFNDPNISKWDVSNVNNMLQMFQLAKSFNQPLNGWKTGNVSNMKAMFSAATVFNGAIETWDVSKVNNMSSMFSQASNFNQPLETWNTENVTLMDSTFYYATKFNQPLNEWNVSNVTSMGSMFSGTTIFTQPLDKWATGNVTTMTKMFYDAKAYNKDLSGWDVSKRPLKTDFATGSPLATTHITFQPTWQ